MIFAPNWIGDKDRLALASDTLAHLRCATGSVIVSGVCRRIPNGQHDEMPMVPRIERAVRNTREGAQKEWTWTWP